jgi:hypothetical protein
MVTEKLVPKSVNLMSGAEANFSTVASWANLVTGFFYQDMMRLLSTLQTLKMMEKY